MEPGQELDVLTGLGNGYSLEESGAGAAAHRRRSRRTAHVSSGQELIAAGKEADGHIRLQYCLRDVLRRRIQGSGSRGKGDHWQTAPTASKALHGGHGQRTILTSTPADLRPCSRP